MDNAIKPEETAVKPEEPKPAKGKKVKTVTEKHKAEEIKFVRLDTEADLDKLILPNDEGDPRWEDRQNLNVPEELIVSMSEEELATTLDVTETSDGKHYVINDGRTRVRAIPEVNKRRKKKGLPPFVLTLAVRPAETEEDVKTILMRSLRANIRMDSPPTTVARQIERYLIADISEEEICRSLPNMTGKKLQGYLALLSKSIPDKVRAQVDAGLITIAAAIALTQIPAGQVEAMAQRMVDAALAGAKVSASDVKKALGVDGGKPATAGQRKQLVLDLNSKKIPGKHGEAATFAAIIALEVAHGTRTIESFWAAFDRIAKGEAVRVDFAQYQDGKAAVTSEK